MSFNNKKYIQGFTLIETLVGVTVFLIISISIYQAYTSLFKFISLNQYKILALNLANEQFEIIRNLSYKDIGIPGGIPDGKIPHVQGFNRGGINFIATTTIRNIDLDFDGTIGGSPNDLSPADNKLISIEIGCMSCISFSPINLITTVAPKNLETSSTNGALLIKVFDSAGIPIPNAEVHIINNKVSPKIIIDDITDSNGLLQIVDAPPGNEAYEITVTKHGYSIDKTYKIDSILNPNPNKAHASVMVQQLTQISFSIDKLSTLKVSSVDIECNNIPNINFVLNGSKTIGTDILKYSNNLSTDSSGQYINDSIEWDSYKIIDNDSNYNIIGLNPLNSIVVNANSTQNVSMIVANKAPKSLLITVKDSITQLPITNASVNISNNDSFDLTKITGRGSINQSDWSPDKFSYNNGSIDVSSPTGEIKLLKVFDNYNPIGIMESETIDIGYTSNFYNLSWLPIDQPINSGIDSVKFQFATNATITDSIIWNYKGPDGTNSTYYTIPDSPISNIHNGDRYARYKVFMNTLSSTSTPNISDISFTVTTSCTPPGQVIFTGLNSDIYTITVNKDGYASKTVDIDINADWQEYEIILSP